MDRIALVLALVLALTSCAGAATPALVEPVPVAERAPEPTPAAPAPRSRCTPVTAVGTIVPRVQGERFGLGDASGQVDYAAHAQAIAEMLHAFFEADLRASEDPASFEGRGPWPAGTYPCIEAIERVDFAVRDFARAEVALRLTGPLKVTMRVEYTRGRWQVATLPPVSAAEARLELERWLAASPDVDVVSSQRTWVERRLVGVGDASGSTLCITGPTPLCWRDARTFTSLGVAWLPRGDASVDEASDEASDRALFELRLHLADDSIELVHVDVDARVWRSAGTLAPRPGPARVAAPFWSPAGGGAPPRTTRVLGPWQPIDDVEAPPWLGNLARLDVWTVPSADVPVLEVRSRDGGGTSLCARLAGWRCGAFDVSRQDWELARFVERAERLGDALLVQSSMRMDGGNGDGSGAYGSSELYVVLADGDGLRVAGWIPLGGMDWETTNRCGDERVCYFRDVRRAYYPWRVVGGSDGGGCLALERLVAEVGTADGSFAMVRRAAGRATPVRRPRGRDALALVALGFPDDEAAPAMASPADDLSGTWRWDGARLVRGACASAAP